MHVFETGGQVRKGIGDWIEYYNQRRPHSSLDCKTLDEAYWSLPRLGQSKRRQETYVHLNLTAKLSNKGGPPLSLIRQDVL
ncbi:MAG: integrase core domain-containing protein [Deltaproteobacteria bacterium]|nr:integrase core domain-containing protein [Deltaproteobacteria bacterium]